jgi:hypothetical protein
MKRIFKSLGIENQIENTKVVQNTWNSFNNVKDNIPHKADYNFASDTLDLPTTKKGFKHLLVVVDLATDEFDIEPMKSTQSEEALKAFQAMFKRKFIKKPYASLRTDGGPEFKGKFHNWLVDENIMHKVALPNRHKQNANVESLNRQISRLLFALMNKVEEDTKKTFNEWVEFVDDVRSELNEHRNKEEGDPVTDDYPVPDVVEPKFKVGDTVYRKSDVPLTALGKQQPTKAFRMGDYRWDLVPRKVEKVLSYSGRNPTRYILDTLPNVSYAEPELKFAENETKEKFVIKQFIAKKVQTIKGKRQVFYKVWWKGYPKSKATWEPEIQLRKDVPNLNEYLLSL